MTIWFSEEMNKMLEEIRPYLKDAVTLKEDTPEHILEMFEQLKVLVKEQEERLSDKCRFFLAKKDE